MRALLYELSVEIRKLERKTSKSIAETSKEASENYFRREWAVVRNDLSRAGHAANDIKGILRERKIDLTVSGHAHGGQWSLFGRGLFAPDQGLFPKYTRGVHEGRLVVSRGLSNSIRLPRIFTPTELLYLTVGR
jgi:hypothetical protein